jgi:hypothetical protein
VNACSFTYSSLVGVTRRVIELYSMIAKAWRRCSEQPCRWWCLCCNRWLCWVGLIFAYVLTTILLILVVVIFSSLVMICWAVCIVLFIFTFGGNFGRANLNCFAADPILPEPKLLPTVIITKPAAGTPAGFYTPNEVITFAATGEDVDGSLLTGSALEWFDTYRGTSNSPLGNGGSISVTLVLLPDDAGAGRVTEHLISAVATGFDGSKSRPSVRSVNIRQGIS